jgi:hypothetical protein
MQKLNKNYTFDNSIDIKDKVNHRVIGFIH